MEQGKEIVGIQYKIKNTNKKAILTLAPIVNFRDFHSMSTDHVFDVKQQINGTKVKLVIDGNSKTPVYMNLSEGKYIEHKNDIFKDMFYIEEQKRGFYPKENHSVTGVYEIELQPNEEKEISFVCGLEENIEEINLNELIKKENERIDDLEYKGLKIIQNQKGFCFGIDAVLLSDFAKNIKKDAKVLDLGTGTGIISILLCGKTNLSKIIGVEVQQEVADMAKRSTKRTKETFPHLSG